MTNLTLNLSLDDEQLTGLDELCADYNADLTREAYLEKVLIGIVTDKMKTMFSRAVTRLSDAANQLPYEKRMALISQVEEGIKR